MYLQIVCEISFCTLQITDFTTTSLCGLLKFKVVRIHYWLCRISFRRLFILIINFALKIYDRLDVVVLVNAVGWGKARWKVLLLLSQPKLGNICTVFWSVKFVTFIDADLDCWYFLLHVIKWFWDRFSKGCRIAVREHNWAPFLGDIRGGHGVALHR